MTKQSEVLDNSKYIPVLDYGFVGLVDSMPGEEGAGDGAIVQAARVSYGTGTKTARTDEGLIRYLIRHKHTTPLEMVEFKFHIKLPIFVARQHIRHRTANVNEYSGRYSEMSNEFYLPNPEHIKPQAKDNKQGRSGELSDKNIQGVQWVISNTAQHSYDAYQTLLGREVEDFYDLYDENHGMFDDDFREMGDTPGGIAKELARTVLPVSNYTEMYWKIDLHNLFHYIKLRADSHAQYEIRVYADAMAKLIQPYVPMAFKAFEDYIQNAHTFSGTEMAVIRKIVAGMRREELEDILLGEGLSLREINEFAGKIYDK